MNRSLTLMLLLLNGIFISAQQLSVPVSDQISGIYSTNVTVSLSHSTPGVTIFYTLNGNEPLPTDFIYTAPIVLQNRIGDPNSHSTIPTNPSFNYPMGTYDLTRANNRGWLEPYTEAYKINVIRFRAYKPGYAPSETVTQTFMVDPVGAAKYSLPILSLVFDSTDLFSNETGIYVYGNHPDGNYAQKGVEWERIANFELFNDQGELVMARDVRARIHGGGSRSSCKKNIRLYGETETSSNFEYPFFDNYDLETFKRILIRSGGHRPDCFPRDDIANMLTEGLSVDQQHVKHIILFINGEYWGIHTIRERVDEYFVQNRYGIDDNEITILDQEYDVQSGHQVDSDEMQSLEDFVMSHDMTLEQNYEFALEKIDVENYIDYMCSEIFLSNEDWVYSNVVIWRKTGPFDPSKPKGLDGKFRWIFYDFDGAFGGSCNNAFYTVNTLNAATVVTGIFSSYSRLFRRLLENPVFKHKFVNRMCDLLNSQYRKNRMHEKITEIYDQLTPEMMETVNRWRYPSTSTTLYTRQSEIPSLTQWDLNFYNLHIFADRRQKRVREHMLNKWGYPDTSIVTINVNDTEMGMVKVNSILVNENLAGIESSIYPWTGHYINTVQLPLVAIPLPGYRFVEWQGLGISEDTLPWMPSGDTSFTAIFEEDLSFQPVLINELMSSNSNFIFDNFNQDDDWIELYNPNNYAVNLSGCKIQRENFIWPIPTGTIINAGAYNLFWCDKESYQGENHVNFKLPNMVGTVYLKSPNNSIIDSLYYPSTSTNYSYGRFPNGSNSFSLFTSPTPYQHNGYVELSENNIPMLTAYPNPTSGNITLSKQIDFAIFDLQGKKLMIGTQQNLIDVSGLENGIYILVSSTHETIKIIVKK